MHSKTLHGDSQRRSKGHDLWRGPLGGRPRRSICRDQSLALASVFLGAVPPPQAGELGQGCQGALAHVKGERHSTIRFAESSQWSRYRARPPCSRLGSAHCINPITWTIDPAVKSHPFSVARTEVSKAVIVKLVELPLLLEVVTGGQQYGCSPRTRGSLPR
jgi:hypothetical protein